MIVYPQSVHDCWTHNIIFFGVDTEKSMGSAYQKAMDFLNQRNLKECNRYVYDGHQMEIKFIWDMTASEFELLQAPLDKYGYEEPDYLGALFFGNFKLEFMKSPRHGGYRNLFQYGAADDPDHPYSYLENGVPYEERLAESEELIMPHRRTFPMFAKNIELQVVKLLNNHPIYIGDAFKTTFPAKWYPGEHSNYTKNFTREA